MLNTVSAIPGLAQPDPFMPDPFMPHGALRGAANRRGVIKNIKLVLLVFIGLLPSAADAQVRDARGYEIKDSGYIGRPQSAESAAERGQVLNLEFKLRIGN